MREISLTQSQVAFVDDEDYTHLQKYAWRLLTQLGRSYALRSEENKTIYMHRVIINAQRGEIVDHIDGNGLNNIRRNLRLVTASGNSFYRHKFPGNSTGYRGVTYSYGRYRAMITYQKTLRHLGTFDTKEEAAMVWGAEAVKLFGEGAPKSKLPPRKSSALTGISLKELLSQCQSN